MRYILIAGMFMFLAFTSNVYAVNSVSSVPAGCELLGVVHVSAEGLALDAKAKREVDALIPVLKKVRNDRFIKIEGGCAYLKHKKKIMLTSLCMLP